MKATGRLDILFAVGGVLAAAMFVVSVGMLVRGMMMLQPLHDMPIAPRKSAIQELTPDQKAVPNSAAVHFRTATTLAPAVAMAEFAAASRLDPTNALPLYFMAANESSTGHYDRACELLNKADPLQRMDGYLALSKYSQRGFPAEVESLSLASAIELPIYSRLLRMAREIGVHSLKLHRAGKSQQALGDLSHVHAMGWKLVTQENSIVIQSLVGIAIVRASDKTAEHIYRDLGDKAALSAINKEQERLTYFCAGVRMYANDMPRQLVARADGAMGMLFAVWVLALHSLCMLLSLIVARSSKTRDDAGSGLNDVAATSAFTTCRLVCYYGLALVLLCASAIGIHIAAGYGSVSLLLSSSLFIMVGTPTLIQVCAESAFTRAYRRAAADAGQPPPPPLRDRPKSEKLGRYRILSGFRGGMMITLFIWAVLVSAYMRATMGVYPWQMEKVTPSIYQQEHQYVRDLVAGKIKVPEKYLREERNRRKASENPVAHLQHGAKESSL